MSDKTTSRSGLGLLGVLQVIFIVMKLCGLIRWRWLYVLTPLWVCIGCTFIYLLILLGVLLWRERKN